jgi:hypothetical protein
VPTCSTISGLCVHLMRLLYIEEDTGRVVMVNNLASVSSRYGHAFRNEINVKNELVRSTM